MTTGSYVWLEASSVSALMFSNEGWMECCCRLRRGNWLLGEAIGSMVLRGADLQRRLLKCAEEVCRTGRRGKIPFKIYDYNILNGNKKIFL